jgi:CRISPR-associated protein Csm4
MTGTTGTGPFAPRQVERLAFRGDARLDVYAAVDEDRLDAATLEQALADVGTMGYGRDASTGLGKFAVESIAEHRWRAAPTGYWLALAPCAPPGQGLDVAACRYLPVTRFGRHGSVAARSATPFKRPVLLAATGAMLVTVDASQRAVIGSGLGGEAAPVSRAMPATVHQGYAPVVPLNMEPHR